MDNGLVILFFMVEELLGMMDDDWNADVVRHPDTNRNAGRIR
jgi:hypothetical protein